MLVTLAGCQSVGVIKPQTVSELRQEAASVGVEDLIVPFAITEEMRQWALNAVPASSRPDRKLQTLSERLFGENFEIEYERHSVGTAEEVFRDHKANCLAFTHLYIGLARELGLPVYFLEVRDLENFEREGDLVVVSDHIAVGYGPSHELMIIDFAAVEGTQYRRIRPIRDMTAVALFYSNRGAEHLRQGRPHEALGWLEKAVKIDPELAAAWINLGVAQRRAGDFVQAQKSYNHALEVDSSAVSAYHNLAALLRLRGQEEEALELLALTDRGSNRNPFSYLALGDLSVRYGRLAEAERFYRRAVRLSEDTAEPFAAMGLLVLENGDRTTARRWLKKARRVDPENPRVLLLTQRLSRSHLR